LRAQLLEMPLEQRVHYDRKKDQLFVNFAGLHVRTQEDVDHIAQVVESCLAPVGHKVVAIVNYDRFSIAPDLVDAYAVMVKTLVERFYSEVTRYAHSSFLRARLEAALGKRLPDTHIHATQSEARKGLQGRS
jgi:propionate CoA-transferase